jgi:hypothetical protein
MNNYSISQQLTYKLAQVLRPMECIHLLNKAKLLHQYTLNISAFRAIPINIITQHHCCQLEIQY